MFEVVLSANSAKTTGLLSSDQFFELRFHTIPVKNAYVNVFSTTITQK